MHDGGQGPLLSDMPEWEGMAARWLRQPPRMIDEALAAAMQQVDFVGHAANPFYKRSLAKGEAASLAFPLGELRQKAKAPLPGSAPPAAAIHWVLLCQDAWQGQAASGRPCALGRTCSRNQHWAAPFCTAV